MKDFLMMFSDDLLSRKQMKLIKGGYGDVTANCSNGTTITCHGSSCISADDSTSGPGFCDCQSGGGPENGGSMDVQICG